MPRSATGEVAHEVSHAKSVMRASSPNLLMTADVEHVFNTYPAPIRARLLALRSLIIAVARETPGVGPLEETLKWGEPSYLTSESKSGITIRLAWKKALPNQFAMYVNCQTELVRMFKKLAPGALNYEGTRAVVFQQNSEWPEAALRKCIAAALTYHRRVKSR